MKFVLFVAMMLIGAIVRWAFVYQKITIRIF